MRMKTMKSGLIETILEENGLKFYTHTRNEAITIAWKMGKGDIIDVPYHNKTLQNLLQIQG
jgi:hypothetical protein